MLLSVRADASYTTALINMPETALCDWRFPTNEQALKFHEAIFLYTMILGLISLAISDKNVILSNTLLFLSSYLVRRQTIYLSNANNIFFLDIIIHLLCILTISFKNI